MPGENLTLSCFPDHLHKLQGNVIQEWKVVICRREVLQADFIKTKPWIYIFAWEQKTRWAVYMQMIWEFKCKC